MKKQLRTVEGVFIITLLITFLVCPGLYVAEETLPTPEEIIAKNIEAIGGIKALKKLKNRKIVQSIKTPSMNMYTKVTIYQERPDMYHTSEDMMGSNGEIVWTNGPPMGTRLFEENATLLREHLFDGPDGPDVHYKSMKTEGIEQVNGKDCYKVVKTPEKGPERIVYYNKKSFLIAKFIDGSGAGFINGTGEWNLFEYYIEEYQKKDNVLFPYKIVRMLKGQRESEITVEVEHNIEMPEGIFDIPEEVKAIMKQIKKQKQTGEYKKFDGTWKGTVPGPDGNPLDITYIFNSSGYNLSGYVSTKFGGGPFHEGKFEGNKISFSVQRPGAIVYMNGTLSDDVINMIQKKGDDVKEFILKRVKQTN